MRYVLEGEWSGYRSSQRRICHRTVIKRIEKYKDLTSIRFTDGTTLDLSIHKCKPRERVKEIRGYDKLIADCISEGVCAVSELGRYKKS